MQIKAIAALLPNNRSIDLGSEYERTKVHVQHRSGQLFIHITTTANISNGSKVNVDINPWALSVGLGTHF